MKDIRFEDICKFIKDEDEVFLEKTNQLLDVILFLTSLKLGSDMGIDPNSIGLIASLIEIKNETTSKISHLFLETYRWITGKKNKTPIEKEKRMAMAYVLIAYSSFFSGLEFIFPKILEEVELLGSEKVRLSKLSSNNLKNKGKNKKNIRDLYTTEFTLSLPHPTESFTSIKHQLEILYIDLSEGFFSFLNSLKIWEELSNIDKNNIESQVNEVPEIAYSHFKAQYYQLSILFPEFYIWASLNSDIDFMENMETFKSEINASQEAEYKMAQEMVKNLKKIDNSIDVGFEQLGTAISKFSNDLYTKDTECAFNQLKNRYTDDIKKPIISDDSNENGIEIKYPNRDEIFVPQSFKVTRYNGKQQLEKENTWPRNIRKNLGYFFLSYLKSSHSFYTPLLILGHPGSGKSMLTRFIAAKTQNSTLTTVRIELRNTKADLKIRDQIIDQIHDITGSQFTWLQLVEWLDGNPLLVIFDGYDELLQVTGKVFSNYIREISDFQEEAYKYDNQPIQVIVTSRITLIDKAVIPNDTTIIKLEPFDSVQRQQWIQIWNKHNSTFFSKNKFEPFSLPKTKQIIELGEQPLLLLMLAIYDADHNTLQNNASLSRTELYFDLIKRFVIREELKDDTIEISDENVNNSILRLGAIAISMFNRRSLDIHSTQLDKDIKYFGLETSNPKREIKKGGWELNQGQKALSSFFFIHQSEAIVSEGNEDDKSKQGSYEFLHNTFGEFLTADFILQQISKEVSAINAYKSTDALKDKVCEYLDNDRAKEWYASLIYTPLFSRPVILQMLREWLNHFLIKTNISKNDFLIALSEIVISELNRILNKNIFPRVMIDAQQNSFDYWPLMGFTAIYTANLILLLAIFQPSDYEWEEELIKSSPDGAKGWDRIINLWRSWFSLDTLYQITSVLNVSKNNHKLILNARTSFNNESSASQLDKIHRISNSIGDNMLFSLSDILIDSKNIETLEHSLIESELYEDMKLKLLKRRLSETNELPYYDQLELILKSIYLLRNTANESRICKNDFESCVEIIINISNVLYFYIDERDFLDLYNKILGILGAELNRSGIKNEKILLMITEFSLKYNIGDQKDYIGWVTRVIFDDFEQPFLFFEKLYYSTEFMSVIQRSIFLEKIDSEIGQLGLFESFDKFIPIKLLIQIVKISHNRKIFDYALAQLLRLDSRHWKHYHMELAILLFNRDEERKTIMNLIISYFEYVLDYENISHSFLLYENELQFIINILIYFDDFMIEMDIHKIYQLFYEFLQKIRENRFPNNIIRLLEAVLPKIKNREIIFLIKEIIETNQYR